MMETYKISVTWESFGEAEIEAENLEEALDKAEADVDEIPLPRANYVDGSFKIDRDMSKYLNMIEEEFACHSEGKNGKDDINVKENK